MSLLKRIATTMVHHKGLTTTARRYLSTVLAPPPCATQHKHTGTTATTAPGRHNTKNTSHTSNTNKKPSLLCEGTLKESYIKGSGPGGQKINKVKNKVLLVHVPTNIQVSVQKNKKFDWQSKNRKKTIGVESASAWTGWREFFGNRTINGNQEKTKKEKQSSKTKATERKWRKRQKINSSQKMVDGGRN